LLREALCWQGSTSHGYGASREHNNGAARRLLGGWPIARDVSE